MSTSNTTSSVYHFQGFVLDVGKRRLINPAGQVTKLGSRAFDTLVLLIQHQGELVTKDDLLNSIWANSVVEENNINQAIWLIRKALDDSSSESDCVRTVPGQGYCFVADIVEENTSNRPPTNITLPTTSSSNIFNTIISHQHFNTTSALFGIIFLSYLLFLVAPNINTETRLTTLPQPQTQGISGTASANRVIPNSIAVLPFTSINHDDSNDLFVLSLHDELISQLSKISNLKVIARDSIASLHGQGLPAFEIANALNVESLIDGTILVLGNKARINLQMLDAGTGVVLWADSLEIDMHDLSEMISIQNQIALNVVNALEVEMHAPEALSIAALPTSSFEAYRYYLAARTTYKHQDDAEKWVLMKKALELDPDYGEAHLRFASINSALFISPLEGFTADDHLQLMIHSTEAYIRLYPQRPDGYALHALALGMQKDWQGVATQIEILKELEPSFAEMKYLAVLLMCLGDFETAINIYEDSLITEPLNLYSRGLLMAVYEMTGNRALAREEYTIGNELKPAWWGDTVNILLALGRDEPLTGVDGLVDITPELINVLQHVDDQELVTHSLAVYLSSEFKTPSESLYYSALAAYYGDNETATSIMRISLDEVPTYIFWTWLPVFDEVRTSEEFKVLLVELGLIQYWQDHGWPETCQPDGDDFACEWKAYSDV